MDLYLIRHGESVNNILADPAQHIADPPLTALGKQQAEHLADYLEKQAIGVTHLYCSPMQRALQTTQPVAQRLGLLPEIWLHAHEHGGVGRRGTGMTRLEIDSLFPGCTMPETITEQGWWTQEGEPIEACYWRATQISAALDQLTQTAPDGKIMLITHGTFISVLLQVILAMPHDETTYFIHNNTGITRLKYRLEGKYIFYINRTEHLHNLNFG